MGNDTDPVSGADFRTLVEQVPVVVYSAERGWDGRWLYLSPDVAGLLGVDPDEILADPAAWDERVHPGDRRKSKWRAPVGLFTGAAPSSAEYRMVRPDGSIVWVLDRAVLATRPDGSTVWHGTLQDITARKLAENLLQRAAAQQGALARLGEMALAGAEADAMIAAAVDSARKVDGVEHCFVWECGEDDTLILRAGLDVSAGGGDWRKVSAGPGTHAGLVAAQGLEVLVEDWRNEKRLEMPALLEELSVRSSLAIGIEGQSGLYGVLDVHSAEPRAFTAEDAHFLKTASRILSGAYIRRSADESLRRQVFHDPLTGLPNRLLFIEQVQSALAASFAAGAAVAVLFIDLDRFKVINDSLGHHVGDELLRAVAPRLRRQLRPGDSVARFGGDEFGVVVSSVADEDAALQVAERIGECLESPFVLDGVEHFVSASIGIAVAPVGSTGEAAAEALIRDADAAMYRAKDNGRSRHELFDHQMRAKVVRRLETERELREAIEREEFTLHYQPVVKLPDGAISGVEALVRWRHPERGLLNPAEFISVAEDTGLIDQIGRWVKEQACLQTLAWQELHPDARPLEVAVNLSARQVGHRDLPRLVAEVLDHTGLDPASLRLEVTESILVEDSDWAGDALRALHELGVKLALDDFGTGYSSLAYLNRFPFDSLKIDRSFVEGVGAEQERDAIVEAIVGMARALGLVVVAEGVENGLQLAELKRLGCDHAQGYFFARPMPPEEITDFLRDPYLLGVDGSEAEGVVLRPGRGVWAGIPDGTQGGSLGGPQVSPA
jgi:diguanylate cyclase (GGDEF)-like protein/PAS domain S-box-containing protein